MDCEYIAGYSESGKVSASAKVLCRNFNAKVKTNKTL